ncbi:TraK family protein [Xanthomonas perforans]|uniref:TraK family protein n=1 Tax=Xanthomonas perforans TaxID=442694 RepID=UPI002B391F6A|nr:TraK family protein [Xanthomonas campestris pv. campestris]
MTTTPKKTTRGPGRVAFLAKKAEIAESVTAGHQLNSIYAGLEQSLGISYSQFARYVKKYITGSTETHGSKPQTNQAQKPIPAPASTPSGQRQSQSSRQPAAPANPTAKPSAGFHHDPIAAKKLDDLV